MFWSSVKPARRFVFRVFAMTEQKKLGENGENHQSSPIMDSPKNLSSEDKTQLHCSSNGSRLFVSSPHKGRTPQQAGLQSDHLVFLKTSGQVFLSVRHLNPSGFGLLFRH